MDPDVTVERAGLPELFATNGTFEWLFAGMDFLVVRKGA